MRTTAALEERVSDEVLLPLLFDEVLEAPVAITMAENTVKASLSNYRVSAQKARLVANQIRGKGVEEALNLLDLSPKRIAGPIAKLVRSAVANAEQKNENQHAGIEIDDLVVSTIYVDEGPSMWRIRPRAQGRAAWIQKRTATINVELSEQGKN